ncbi:MAG: multidrug efflux SMR transporter [Actinomycetia bacterium]|nr:multidrug efflux SMR transporter [Actinomycetes bacterium]
MHWLALLGAIAFEIIGTLSLKATDGFRRVGPTLVVLVGYGLSFWLLSVALRGIEVGVAYAIWSAVGTTVIAAFGILAWGESVTTLKVVSLGLVVAGVVGLNLAARAPA